MEALWKTEPAPAAFNVIAAPSQSERTNLWQVQVPAALSLLVTHSLDGTVPGADELEQQAAARIRSGIPAVVALKRLAQDPTDAQAMAPRYAELHRNILDVFNEYGVQIMSPHYVNDPDGPKLASKDRWYSAPAKPPGDPGKKR